MHMCVPNLIVLAIHGGCSLSADGDACQQVAS